MPPRQTWIDRTLTALAPRYQLSRVRARVAIDLVARHYEGASVGRRTQGWSARGSDANTAQQGVTLARLRDVARDLVRNNPYAESTISTIGDDAVGWGIVAKPRPANESLLARWRAWAESIDCDADGRDTFYGLQKLVMQTVARDGECLIRRRNRRLSDGYSLPLQLQVLEADFLDTLRSGPLPNGGHIVQGVEFDALGTRVAYWLFPQHPGASSVSTTTASLFPASRRIDASEIAHVYKRSRPGQVRGASWFAPVILRMKDFDDYEDATLMKQKVAACLSVVTTDIDGRGQGLGTTDDSTNPGVDTIAPGSVLNLPLGRSVEVVTPPTVNDHESYSTVTLRAIAAGLNIGYEDLTGDYSKVNFSSARLARLRHMKRVDDWRWRILLPQFCDVVWNWAMEAAAILGEQAPANVEWTPPPLPMIEPDKEGLAILRNVRAGIQTLSDALRERGYDVDDFFTEYKSDLDRLDRLKILLDSDPRHMTQAGQSQAALSGSASGGDSSINGNA